jgi:Tol biopolymer transport system component
VKVDADSMLGQPAWSPDGKSIAYERGARSKNMYATQGQLEVLPLASGHPVVVFRDQQVNGTLTWVPDGRIIYSLSETAPNQNDSNLWALHVDSLGHASGAPARLTRQPGIAAFPSVTANGKRLAYFRRSIAPDVYIADLLDHGTRLSPLRRLTLDDRADFPYTWLADNRSVIFISNRNGPYSIFKQDIDKPEPELVVGGPDDLMIARLSPDSRSLLYMIRPKLGDASGVARLMRVSLDGGPPKVILSLPEMNNYQCARAPATACIVARIEGGRDRFHYFDLEKGLGAEIPSAEIRSNNAYDFNWTLSPDGRLLASARKGGIQKDPVLQVLSLTDNSRHSIPIPGWAGIHTLDWAADGKSVWATAYTSSGAQALLNVDLTGKVRSVLEEDKMSLGWAIPSPDGKHLAIWRASGSSNVSMLENF